MGEGAKASLAAFEYLLSHEVVEVESESAAA
jgi:alkyl hydroperoxide reductase subunit F